MYYKIKQYLYNNNIDIEKVKNKFKIVEEPSRLKPYIAEWNIRRVEKPTTILLDSLIIDETINYKENREREYPSTKDQLDLIYWDKINKTKKWQKEMTKIKNKYPKPNSPLRFWDNIKSILRT